MWVPYAFSDRMKVRLTSTSTVETKRCVETCV